MIVNCPNCSANLQLDDAKVPERAFTVRCPKCQHIINAQPPAPDRSALGAGEAPAMAGSRFERNAPASAVKLDPVAGENNAARLEAPVTDTGEVLRLLASLLQRSMATEAAKVGGRLSWEMRSALVCVTPMQRDQVARLLAEKHYEVFTADNTTQAIERMREERMDVLVLDSEFDPVEQGAIFIKREINALRPAQRRRLFFVLLSPSARTGDTHAAFVNHVNLVVNAAELERLPQALERSLRDFNDFYRDFNQALDVTAL